MTGSNISTGVHQDTSLRPESPDDQPSITVKISFPDLIFEVVIQLGENGVEVGNSGFHFTYMKFIVSKRLIGLELKCKIEMDSQKADKQLSTFTGEVAVSFVLFLYNGKPFNKFCKQVTKLFILRIKIV